VFQGGTSLLNLRVHFRSRVAPLYLNLRVHFRSRVAPLYLNLQVHFRSRVAYYAVFVLKSQWVCLAGAGDFLAGIVLRCLRVWFVLASDAEWSRLRRRAIAMSMIFMPI